MPGYKKTSNSCAICAELIADGKATLRELTEYYDAEDMLIIYEAIAVKRFNEYSAMKLNK